MRKMVPVMALLALFSIACSKQRSVSYKDAVENSLHQQANFKDVDVKEDRDKNVITLGGGTR